LPGATNYGWLGGHLQSGGGVLELSVSMNSGESAEVLGS
jgi:hypothetical protein